MRNVEIRGDDALIYYLGKLSGKEGKAALRKAMRKGAKPIQKSAKELAPKKTGQLAENIKVKALKRKKNRIGVRITASFGAFGNDEFYGLFQERGWQQGRRVGKAERVTLGDRRKHIPGKFYMKRAGDQNERQALDIITMELAKEVQRMAK